MKKEKKTVTLHRQKRRMSRMTECFLTGGANKTDWVATRLDFVFRHALPIVTNTISQPCQLQFRLTRKKG